MSFQEFYDLFAKGIREITWPEIVAVVTGIGSVYFSRLENILVYPVGLVSTVLYVWISFDNHLLGEAAVNIYYTVMSIYGWILWARRNAHQEHVVRISFSSKKEWMQQLAFFGFFYITLYISLTYARQSFFSGAIPWGDAFASATAFTGMWLMAKKKVESWFWWIATNIASIPLYFVKSLVLTSLFYGVLLVMAFFGLAEWKRRARLKLQQSQSI
jgi:nicotinamide mononucleotide transporter